MLENGNIIKNPDLVLSEKRELSNIINYFTYNHELDDIKLLPKGFETKNMEDIFGFKYQEYLPAGGDQYLQVLRDVWIQLSPPVPHSGEVP